MLARLAMPDPIAARGAVATMMAVLALIAPESSACTDHAGCTGPHAFCNVENVSNHFR